MKKNVLILANESNYTYNLRSALIKSLIDSGCNVTIACELLQFQQELKQMGCKLIGLDFSRRGTNPFSDLKLMAKYLNILKTEKPDVVLSYNIKPNVYGGLACQMRKVQYLPNITGLGTAVEYPGKMQALTTRLYKWGVAGAQCVLFQNSENEEFFRQRNMLSKKSRTRLLPGSGVDLQAHPLLPYPQEDTIHFLFVARVLKEKGIDQYLAAAKALRAERKDVVFHICGGCDDAAYEEILRQAQEAGEVIYHGQQKDMLPFFQMAACVVHPSYYPEGMSNVLQEAAASGRPIIAANRSGCRETVDDGKTGYIVPIKDEQAVIDAVRSFLNLSWEERRDMGLAGRAKMEREFDRQIVVQQYLEELAILTSNEK